MTLIDTKTVAKVARLSQLKIEEAELEQYSKDLSRIMGLMDELNEVDTSNVQPMTSTSDIDLQWRKDVVTDGGIQQDILANAPEAVEGYFVVQKVVE